MPNPVRYAFVFGRTPGLSKGELIQLLTAWGYSFQEIASDRGFWVMEFERDPVPIFDRLGGTVKIVELGDQSKVTQKASDRRKSVSLFTTLPALPEGKISFGVSLYGGGTAREKRDLEIRFKEELRRRARNARFVRSETLALSSGTVTRERLLEKGFEFCRVYAGGRIYEGYAVWVQPIAEFASRDQERPHRDPRVGMLPPKLAKMLVNLAATGPPETASGAVYDPFCGTGTILQETLLLGYKAAGGDINEKMVRYTIANLQWLKSRFGGFQGPSEVALREASEPPSYQCEAVATEGYLGPPRSRLPSRSERESLDRELRELYAEVFEAFRAALRPGKRFVVCFPFFIESGRQSRLPFVDAFRPSGYNLEGSYTYRREDQIVGRDIRIFTRI